MLIMQGEDAPQWQNRVDLDPALKDVNGLPVPRITYRPHVFEGYATPNSSHIMGTLRMGADPATSVTDANCKFHDLDNLYSVDGAPFTTSSGFNPTLTLQALASRTAAAIIDPAHPVSVIEKEPA